MAPAMFPTPTPTHCEARAWAAGQSTASLTNAKPGTRKMKLSGKSLEAWKGSGRGTCARLTARLDTEGKRAAELAGCESPGEKGQVLPRICCQEAMLTVGVPASAKPSPLSGVPWGGQVWMWMCAEPWRRIRVFTLSLAVDQRVSLVTQLIKNLPVVQETRVGSLGQGDPLEKELITYTSILAWEIP